ncbi:FecCD family ABC transporter permease [Campylobacter fetus]|uniref:FecCD family ABC transporter permease n=1 Tax=Campylobacter fetus TaxID=196 RepID=UPI00288F2EB0|nr:iron ABC transporter permease [Campylobacter fetus subsp. venerealis]
MCIKSYLIISFLICLLVLTIISLALGGASVGFNEIFNLYSQDLSDTQKTILIDIRLPRIVMAILIGALLASSGVVVQTIFLNPLADPYIIGIASSATFGAVVAYIFGLEDIYYGIFAFIASCILSIVIFKLSKNGRSVATLLIIGIAFSSMLGAFTSLATYLIGEDSFKIIAWMMGYLGGASWFKVGLLTLPLILSLIYFYKKRNELNLLLSGDEEAKSLGADVDITKKRLLIVASLSVAFSVAFTGMIGFVGLIIPHILRMILGTSNNAVLIPISTLAGALFLLFCDLVAKNVLNPTEIPIGVVTAFFGAPFFLFLAIKYSKGVI